MILNQTTKTRSGRDGTKPVYTTVDRVIGLDKDGVSWAIALVR